MCDVPFLKRKERKEKEKKKKREKKRRENGISEVDYWRREGEWHVGKQERERRKEEKETAVDLTCHRESSERESKKEKRRGVVPLPHSKEQPQWWPSMFTTGGDVETGRDRWERDKRGRG